MTSTDPGAGLVAASTSQILDLVLKVAESTREIGHDLTDEFAELPIGCGCSPPHFSGGRGTPGATLSCYCTLSRASARKLSSCLYYSALIVTDSETVTVHTLSVVARISRYVRSGGKSPRSEAHGRVPARLRGIHPEVTSWTVAHGVSVPHACSMEERSNSRNKPAPTPHPRKGRGAECGRDAGNRPGWAAPALTARRCRGGCARFPRYRPCSVTSQRTALSPRH